MRACVGRAGILTAEEFDGALAAWEPVLGRRGTGPGEAVLSPYVLTGAPGRTETAALRWDWDISRTGAFAGWCERALATRFSIAWQVRGEPGDRCDAPEYLVLSREGQSERCDWRYLNAHRWAGAFCTIADRLLRPVGVTALELETGWFDVVICFCAAECADEVLSSFGEAE